MADNTIPCASNDQNVWVMNAVPDIQVVDPETGEAITLVSRNVDDDDYYLGLATNPCLATTTATAAEAVDAEAPPTVEPTRRPTRKPSGRPSVRSTTATGAESASTTDVDTTTTMTTTEETGETAATTEEGRAFFYSCGSHGSAGDAASSFLPDDATEMTLVYDYELHTSSPLDADVLSSFENSVAYDLANRYGLIDCRRRNLRSLEGGGLIALDSAPMDESLTDTYECGVQVNLASTTSCTPIRGYMTAWLPSSNSDAVQTEAELLEFIESGMKSDSYTSDDVVKVAYVGTRPDSSQGSIVVGNANAETGNGGGGGVGMVSYFSGGPEDDEVHSL
ncbi:hypothetical protein ACHAW5_000208 [Stephanodiscus triporus]|uniref:Uncharacterized protein n=1 Tax=Stephanodiscus triporus TaxID=2934178 RepID=A0ABD3MKQ8_9STRA